MHHPPEPVVVVELSGTYLLSSTAEFFRSEPE
jgi:hypothetical protein